MGHIPGNTGDQRRDSWLFARWTRTLKLVAPGLKDPLSVRAPMTKRWCAQLEKLRDYSMPLSPFRSHETKEKINHQEERLATWKAFHVSRKNPLLAPIPGGAMLTSITSTGLGQCPRWRLEEKGA